MQHNIGRKKIIVANLLKSVAFILRCVILYLVAIHATRNEVFLWWMLTNFTEK